MIEDKAEVDLGARLTAYIGGHPGVSFTELTNALNVEPKELWTQLWDGIDHDRYGKDTVKIARETRFYPPGAAIPNHEPTPTVAFKPARKRWHRQPRASNSARRTIKDGTFVPNAVLNHPAATPARKAVATELSRHFWRMRRARPKQKALSTARLAENAGISRSGARLAIEWLIKEKLLDRVETGTGRRGHVYRWSLKTKTYKSRRKIDAETPTSIS